MRQSDCTTTERTMMSLTEKMIWQIEMHLGDPLTVASLSDLCAVSPYHMVRSFRQATGLSPITYLRARRLSVAAERLATGDQGILAIALDAQYNSHAAFTRAFVSYFGVLPLRLRQTGSLGGLNLMEPMNMMKHMIVDVAAPEIKTRDSFRVAGPSARCSFEDNSPIPPLWQQFNARMAEIETDTDSRAYGVCCDADGAGHFRYVAGLEVAASSGIPQGMDDVTIPAGRYAVFTHTGHIADFPKTVYSVWNKALPDAGLEPRQAPEFEVYDKRFDVATGRGVVELWIPVT